MGLRCSRRLVGHLMKLGIPLEAWHTIERNFGDDPKDIEKARIRLAEALLSIATEDSRDVQALKNGGLQAMALGYREPRTHAVDEVAPKPDIVGTRESFVAFAEHGGQGQPSSLRADMRRD
jgi:hypothetical protein